MTRAHARPRSFRSVGPVGRSGRSVARTVHGLSTDCPRTVHGRRSKFSGKSNIRASIFGDALWCSEDARRHRGGGPGPPSVVPLIIIDIMGQLPINQEMGAELERKIMEARQGAAELQIWRVDGASQTFALCPLHSQQAARFVDFERVSFRPVNIGCCAWCAKKEGYDYV